jgi:ElaB/YqjD/DUF883 family membrane-anchored ribosome-binding protein
VIPDSYSGILDEPKRNRCKHKKLQTMKTSLKNHDLDAAKHDIQHLLKVTSHMADEAVVAARDRLAKALDKAGATCGVRAEIAGKYMRKHACETAVISLIIGIAAGYAISRSNDT